MKLKKNIRTYLEYYLFVTLIMLCMIDSISLLGACIIALIAISDLLAWFLLKKY